MGCPFNNAILCEGTKKCGSCGWNKNVDEERRIILRHRRQKLLAKKGRCYE